METRGASQVKSVGLAKYDSSNKLPLEYVLSTDKVGAITPANVQSMLGNQYSFQLLITTLKTGKTIRDLNSVGNTKTREDAPDVVAVERIVSISEFDIVTEFKNIKLLSRPPQYTGYFLTNRAYLDAFDYYVYIENADKVSSATTSWVEINGVSGNNRVVPSNAFQSTPHWYDI